MEPWQIGSLFIAVELLVLFSWFWLVKDLPAPTYSSRADKDVDDNVTLMLCLAACTAVAAM